jgi:hypothetical protein
MPTMMPTKLAIKTATFQPRSLRMAQEVEAIMSTFNVEQQAVYQQLQDTLEDPNKPCLYFLDGKAGCSKTFLINCLVTSIRTARDVVIVEALQPEALSTTSVGELPIVPLIF